MSDYKRLTINIESGLYAELQRSAEQRGITVTELIRRAVALDQHVWDHHETGAGIAAEGDET